MKGNLNFLFAILLVLGIVSLALLTRSCSRAPVPAYFDRAVSLDDALARAHQRNRPVLALVSADWCPPCADLKRGALADPAVAAWISANTEPVYIDLTRSSGRDAESQAFADRLGFEALPAIVILGRGGFNGRIEGNVPTAALLKWLERAKSELDRQSAP